MSSSTLEKHGGKSGNDLLQGGESVLTAEFVRHALSKKGRKAERTRRHIAEAAAELFEAKGFSSTTVEEIADAADYSTSTFFRYFADKEEVVFYDFADRLMVLKSIFALPNHSNAWDTIRNAFIEYARFWDSEKGELGMRRARLFHKEPALNARYLLKNEEWEIEIAKLVSAEFNNDPTQELLCQVIAGATVAAFRASWRAKFADEHRLLADCVQDASDRLERIGEFFQTRE